MRYLDDYIKMHKQPNMMQGRQLVPHKDNIYRMIVETDTYSLLDFGSGKGLQYSIDMAHKDWGIHPRLYDPAVEGIDQLPEGRFEGVICTSVMEHIPEEEVWDTLWLIYRYAAKMVYFSISLNPSSHLLSDGTSIHCTIKSEHWWLHRILENNPEMIPTAVRFRHPGNRWTSSQLYVSGIFQ